MTTTPTPDYIKPAIQGTFGGCLNCGPRPSLFPPEAIIAVGFGCAILTKNGQPVYEEPIGDDVTEDDYMTGAQAEDVASLQPDHDWRIVLHAPMSGREYQRHGVGQWALIHQDQGFA